MRLAGMVHVGSSKNTATAAAGITKPTLYHYFGSKQGLLEALLAEHFERLNRQVREAAFYQGDLPETLRRGCLGLRSARRSIGAGGIVHVMIALRG